MYIVVQKREIRIRLENSWGNCSVVRQLPIMIFQGNDSGVRNAYSGITMRGSDNLQVKAKCWRFDFGIETYISTSISSR